MDIHEIGLVNCASCNRQLYGEKTMARRDQGDDIPPLLVRTFDTAGRVAGRPYCAGCLPKAEGVAWSR